MTLLYKISDPMLQVNAMYPYKYMIHMYCNKNTPQFFNTRPVNGLRFDGTMDSVYFRGLGLGNYSKITKGINRSQKVKIYFQTKHEIKIYTKKRDEYNTFVKIENKEDYKIIRITT